MKPVFSYLVAGIVAIGCAHNPEENNKPLKLAETSKDIQRAAVATTSASGMADYTHEGQKGQAEWISCQLKDAKQAVLVMHRDKRGYDRSQFCNGWIAQTFLASGFSVVAVNRPGYAQSTGKPDFGGARSVAAIVAGANAGQKAAGAALVGIWGYSSGATAAAFSSKQLKLQWIVLGGGVYNADETLKHTKDPYLRRELSSIKNTGGDVAMENRSIAYDPEGLPKRVALYHGKKDVAVPSDQASSFHDNLATMEYKVTLQLIDGFQHDMPAAHHRQMLEIILKSL